jgi:hypothetical protein
VELKSPGSYKLRVASKLLTAAYANGVSKVARQGFVNSN